MRIFLFISTLIIFIIFFIFYFTLNENFFLSFLKNNKDRIAIKFAYNNDTICEINQDKMMPLASVLKTIIAIEYAYQIYENKINPDEKVSILELDKFYVKWADFLGHKAWLDNSKKLIFDDYISLNEVVRGMIKYSSNANTEYLSEKLCLENINNRIKKLDINHHNEIYYLVSSIFVSKEKFPWLKKKELSKNLENLSYKEYVNQTNIIHSKLLSDPSYKLYLDGFTADIQKTRSKKLPSSTASEYFSLAQKINSKTYFPPEVQKILDDIMQSMLWKLPNIESLEYIWGKWGSTLSILNNVIYATDKEKNKVEIVYFINKLSIFENIKLQYSMESFESKILTDKHFRNKIKLELNK